MTTKQSPLQVLLTVSFDTGVAVVLAAVIGMLLLVSGNLSADGSTWTIDPFASWSSWQLTVDDTSDPVAAALVAELRQRLSGDDGRYHLEWEEHEGTLWLSAWFSDPSVRATIAGVIRDSGLWTNSVQVGTNWGRAFEAFVADPISSLQAHGWVISFLMPVSGVVFLVAGAALRRLRPIAGFESTPPPWGRAVPLGVALGAAGYAAAHLTLTLFRSLGVAGREQNWIVDLAQGKTLVVAALAATAVCVAPVGEELFFRGHVFRYVSSNAGAPLAYVSSAVLFSTVHFNASGIPAYVVAALLLGWSYDRWRSLRVPMILHATWNAIGVALLLM